MAEDLDVIRAALRVVNALCEGSPVYRGDLGKLRNAIPELPVSVPMDQLACEVIQRAFRDRKVQ